MMEDFNGQDPTGNVWPNTMDAKVWADAFEHYNPDNAFGHETMLGWFANAIMAGYDEAKRHASSPFADQARFMHACGQSTVARNERQALLYDELIREEHGEWKDAMRGEVEDLDAVIDQIVVLIGYGLSQGWDIVGAWNEVMRSNFAKVGDDGYVRRREDGKILKPEGWTPPNLYPFLRRPA